jgi:hypothetical protein
MVVCNECIKNVLNRIFLEGVARFGEPPQIYWDAIHALEQLDKTCLTINSTSDPNSPIGWRRNNYPILVVGKKNNKLKFSYTKKGLNNGKILITVEEVADVYGNILTENNNNNIKNMKQVIRLTESDLHRVVKESVKKILKETRLDYDEDNFSGRYNRSVDDTVSYKDKLFAFDVDDRGKIYKYGQIPVDVISQCEREAERYGQGHCFVETYENEEDYINAISNYIRKGYIVTN